MSWEDKVRKTDPYVAGEQPKEKNIIKLNTNECPYPPAPGVAAAARDLETREPDLRLYPDMDATVLVNALADFYKVKSSQIFVGVGSDDVLAMCFLTFFTNGKKVLFPNITYSFYPVWAQLYRIPYEEMPLREDFTIDANDYIPRSGEEFGGIIFPNPNAPTGIEEPQEKIEEIVRANPNCVVIIDEAYVDFGAESALPLLKKYDNLLIVQTFSKSRAMAGERIGFAIGGEKIINYLKDVKFSFNSYTMNLPSILLGTAAVKDADYFYMTTGKIAATRERFERELNVMGFSFPESKANFVFAKPPRMSGEEMFHELRKKNIVVRWWDKPLIRDYMRITIGTDEQMDSVVKAMREILS